MVLRKISRKRRSMKKSQKRISHVRNRHISSRTKKTRKNGSCRKHYVRSSKTNRCYKLGGSVWRKRRGLSRKRILSRRRSRKISPSRRRYNKACEGGKIRNRSTGRCWTKGKSAWKQANPCPKGSVRDSETLRCYKLGGPVWKSKHLNFLKEKNEVDMNQLKQMLQALVPQQQVVPQQQPKNLIMLNPKTPYFGSPRLNIQEKVQQEIRKSISPVAQKIVPQEEVSQKVVADVITKTVQSVAAQAVQDVKQGNKTPTQAINDAVNETKQIVKEVTKQQSVIQQSVTQQSVTQQEKKSLSSQKSSPQLLSPQVQIQLSKNQSVLFEKIKNSPELINLGEIQSPPPETIIRKIINTIKFLIPKPQEALPTLLLSFYLINNMLINKMNTTTDYIDKSVDDGAYFGEIKFV